MKPNEKKTFTFTLKFEEPKMYKVCARVREVKVVETVGTPKWEKFVAVSRLGRNLTLAGSGWQVTLEPVGAVKEDRKVLKCVTMYDILMILGAVGAIVSAVFSILGFFMR